MLCLHKVFLAYVPEGLTDGEKQAEEEVCSSQFAVRSREARV